MRSRDVSRRRGKREHRAPEGSTGDQTELARFHCSGTHGSTLIQRIAGSASACCISARRSVEGVRLWQSQGFIRFPSNRSGEARTLGLSKHAGTPFGWAIGTFWQIQIVIGSPKREDPAAWQSERRHLMNVKPRPGVAGQVRRTPGRARRYLCLMLLGCAGMVTHASAAAPEPGAAITPEQNFQLALEAQTAREYRKMMFHLRQAAEAGNVEAQEMLGMALLVGPTLYGSAVKAGRCEAATWMRRAAAQGSDVGKHQLTFLNRLRQAPSGKDVCQPAAG